MVPMRKGPLAGLFSCSATAPLGAVPALTFVAGSSRPSGAVSSGTAVAAGSARPAFRSARRGCADGAAAGRNHPAEGSVPRHRRCIPSRRFPRGCGRRAGSWPAASLPELPDTIPRCVLNSGSTSKITPRNGSRRCFTTSPIENLAVLTFFIVQPHHFPCSSAWMRSVRGPFSLCGRAGEMRSRCPDTCPRA